MSTDDGLRHTPIQRALHRDNLVMGGERELVLLSAVICGGLIITAQNLVAVFVCVPLWLIILFLLRKLAKTDAHMSRVFIRQRAFRPYYPPRSTPFYRNK